MSNFAAIKTNKMRQIVKAKDIQKYFGKKESMSFKIIKTIKKELHKKNHQPVTIDDFCNYYGVTKDSISQIIEENDAKNETSKNPTSDSDVSLEAPVELKQEPTKATPYHFSKSTY